MSSSVRERCLLQKKVIIKEESQAEARGRDKVRKEEEWRRQGPAGKNDTKPWIYKKNYIYLFMIFICTFILKFLLYTFFIRSKISLYLSLKPVLNDIYSRHASTFCFLDRNHILSFSIARMSPVSAWTAVLLQLLLTTPFLAGHSIKARQTVDELSDNALICALLASAGENCTTSTDNRTPIPVTDPAPDPVTPGLGCTCVPWWGCHDNTVTAAPDGDLLTVVNVRNAVGCSSPEDVCCSSSQTDPTVAPPTERPYIPICGKRNPTGIGAVFQGFSDRQSQFGEFPWMAAVVSSSLNEINNASLYISGASLINPQVVLTAAHYVQDKTAEQLSVRLGEWNFKLPSEPIPHQDFKVSRIVIHPGFSPNNLHYDVALLFLDREVQLGPTIDTICLPDAFQEFDGERCFSSGWGKDMFGKEGKFQQILKSIELPAVSHSACQNAMRRTRLGKGFLLHRSFTCAGGEAGSDVCTGDGGSPLICPMPSDPTRYVQAGIVAWGIGCGQEGLPGVYASVSQTVDWIQTEVQSSLGFDVRLGQGGR